MGKAFAYVVLAAVALGACGSSSTESNSSSFKCCVNGAYYECATQEAMSHCSQQDMAQFCPRQSSGDAKCR